MRTIYTGTTGKLCMYVFLYYLYCVYESSHGLYFEEKKYSWRKRKEAQLGGGECSTGQNRTLVIEVFGQV